ncbi:zinc-binding protein A33-like [Notolabrus celidotus]|uniref:zinc-binding protein A33-like n=1 Tax=Notolabrus celidotus TaxID=1203425 RepID=UPI00148F6E95|nr:zinc-binding protein A33-like [Notolabrus celidotus]
MTSTIEADLSCPVCHEIFEEPVVLPCTHSFCKECLQGWWREKHSRECPVCKAVSKTAEPPVSLVLRNLCESFLLTGDQTPSEDLCPLHSEKLSLFCLSHNERVCLICRDSEIHTNHEIRPYNEMKPMAKDALLGKLEYVRREIQIFHDFKVQLTLAGEFMKKQARQTEKRIREEFKKLHQFLELEEVTRLAAVKQEEKHKEDVLKEMCTAVGKDIEVLYAAVKTTEEGIRSEDCWQKNKDLVRGLTMRPLPEAPKLPRGFLIDEATHLGNLPFNVWNKMKQMVSYSPVILDRNTLNTVLTLSEDLTVIKCRDLSKIVTLKTPDNPERYVHLLSVLGSQGFDSGTHTWDVKVTDERSWDLGVSEESDYRNGNGLYGLWTIGTLHGKYSAQHGSNNWADLEVKDKPKRIRVSLSWDRGLLSFTDLNTNKLIHSIKHTFTRKVFPYFSGEMKIVPLKVGVELEQ